MTEQRHQDKCRPRWWPFLYCRVPCRFVAAAPNTQRPEVIVVRLSAFQAQEFLQKGIELITIMEEKNFRLIKAPAETFLNLRHFPARLNAAQTAALLGFHEDNIPLLLQAKLLKALGNPCPTAVKTFALVEVMEKSRDQTWLDKASKHIMQHWKKKNVRRQDNSRVMITGSLDSVRN